MDIRNCFGTLKDFSMNCLNIKNNLPRFFGDGELKNIEYGNLH